MERTKTFVNGGRLYPADINAIEDRAAEMLEGTAAAIPSSHFAGRYYRATDTNDLYLDNGTTWKKIAGKEVINDEQVVTGRALVETGNSYSALTERTTETEYEPSATRMAWVQLAWSGNNCEELTVGGVVLQKSPTTSITGFPCPPKVKWKAKFVSGTLKSSYLLS